MTLLRKILFIKLIVILLIMNFVSAQNNFSLEVEIPETYKTLEAGEKIYFTTRIFSFEGEGRKDIILTYEISNGEIIATKSETVTIENQASSVGNLKIPKKTPVGNYNLNVTLIFNKEEEASRQDSFKIMKEKIKINTAFFLTLSTIVVIITLSYIIIFKAKREIDKIIIKMEIDKMIKNKIKNLGIKKFHK